VRGGGPRHPPSCACIVMCMFLTHASGACFLLPICCPIHQLRDDIRQLDKQHAAISSALNFCRSNIAAIRTRKSSSTTTSTAIVRSTVVGANYCARIANSTQPTIHSARFDNSTISLSNVHHMQLFQNLHARACGNGNYALRRCVLHLATRAVHAACIFCTLHHAPDTQNGGCGPRPARACTAPRARALAR
jgi:hypothetical protein